MQPYIGQIMPVGFNFPPRGWSLCDGQLLSISANTALFSLLGTTFGGDGRTTFQLPDLRGRSICGVGQGAGLKNMVWGQKMGSDSIYLNVNQLPAHNHSATGEMVVLSGAPSETAGNDYKLGNGVLYTEDGTDVQLAAGSVKVTTGQTGANAAISIMQPVLGIYVCIAMTGIYPSRN